MRQADRVEYPISIHAPARGATGFVQLILMELYDFYPRSRKGSDAISAVMNGVTEDFYPRSRKGSDAFYFSFLCTTILFLSTLPQGERLNSSFAAAPLLYFYPRSRKGSDRICSISRILHLHFYPRSRKGSDPGRHIHNC